MNGDKLLVLEEFLENPRKFGRPRLHGNGFIQVDLDDMTRLHVWDPRLPRQKVSTQIHDHRFSFESHVLLGKLRHITYHTCAVGPAEATHQVYVARPRHGANTELVQAGGCPLAVAVSSRIELAAGSSYTFRALEFHESGADQLTATIMTKTAVYHSHEPQVLVACGQEPDNDFNRYAFESNYEVQQIYADAVGQLLMRYES